MMNQLSIPDDATKSIDLGERITPAWKDVPPESRPPSPRVEYFTSPVDIKQAEMLRRWEGLGYNWQLREIFAVPFMERNIERIRTVRRVLYDGQDLFSPEIVQKRLRQVFAQLQEIEDAQLFVLTERQEPYVVEKTEENGNITFAEQWVAMNSRQMAYHASVLGTVRDEQRHVREEYEAAQPGNRLNVTDEKLSEAERKLKEFRERNGFTLNVNVNTSGAPPTVTVSEPMPASMPEPARGRELEGEIIEP